MSSRKAVVGFSLPFGRKSADLQNRSALRLLRLVASGRACLQAATAHTHFFFQNVSFLWTLTISCGAMGRFTLYPLRVCRLEAFKNFCLKA